MSDKKLYRKYPDDVVESQEQFDHALAMTSENLRSKSEIASELAYRDIIIKGLRAEIAEINHEKAVIDRRYNELLQAAENMLKELKNE